MKKIIVGLILFVSVGLLYAVDYTRNTPRVRQVQFSVNYASDGSVASVDSQAVFFGYWVQVGDTSNYFDDSAVRTIKSYNLIASPSTQITAAGATVTRAQLAALIRQDAIDRP